MYNILSFGQKSKLVPPNNHLEFSLLIKLSLHTSPPPEILAALGHLWRFKLITWSQTGKSRDSLFPNVRFVFSEIKFNEYGFKISQLHNFPLVCSSFLKGIIISQLNGHFGRGNNQKESPSSQVIILIFENKE